MYGRQTRKNLGFMSLALTAALTAHTFMAPVDAAQCPNITAQVAKGKLALQKGNIDQAIQILSKVAKEVKDAPGSCECHYNLGKALCAKAKTDKATNAKTSDAEYILGKRELRTAIRVGKGNLLAKQANEFLMANVPKNLLSPRMGEGTELIAAKLGIRSFERGAATAAPKGKVLQFYADWCVPCQELKPVLDKVAMQYGDQVEIQSINVDDKNNAEIIDQYDVSPIPTVIYLDTAGQVVGYSIGYSGEKSVHKELQKILATPTANKS